MLDAYLAVVANRETGLFHGALFRNRPTPSGCARYLLSTTVNEGFVSSRSAAASANAAFPDFEPLDLDACADDDLPETGFGLHPRCVITRIRPQRASVVQDDAPEVEVTVGGKVVPVVVTVAQFERLQSLGHIELESSSGADPGLSYHYDHYELTAVGRAYHAAGRVAAVQAVPEARA